MITTSTEASASIVAAINGPLVVWSFGLKTLEYLAPPVTAVFADSEETVYALLPMLTAGGRRIIERAPEALTIEAAIERVRQAGLPLLKVVNALYETVLELEVSEDYV